ncbi:MAG: hypothetical protein AAGK14_03245 [Verrucomicrobiota bacterium]
MSTGLERVWSGLVRAGDGVIAWLDRLLTSCGKLWLPLVLWSALLLSFVTAMPNLGIFMYPAGQGYLEKIEDPWRDMRADYRDRQHESKLNLRLTVPLTLNMLGINHPLALGVVCILAVLGLWAWTGAFLEKVSGDRVVGALFVLYLAQTYVGMFGWPFLNYDSVALLLVVAGFCRWPPGLNTLWIFLALWTDERAFVAALFPLFYHLVRRVETPRERWLCAGGVLLAYALAVATRFWVTAVTGLETPTSGVVTVWMLGHLMEFAHIGILYSLEGGWLLVAAAVLLAWTAGRRWLALGFTVLVGLQYGTGFTAADVSRNLSYLMPAAFCAALLFLELEPDRQARRRLMLVVAVVSFLLSNYVIFGYLHQDENAKGWVRWIRPLPVDVVEQAVQERYPAPAYTRPSQPDPSDPPED